MTAWYPFFIYLRLPQKISTITVSAVGLRSAVRSSDMYGTHSSADDSRLCDDTVHTDIQALTFYSFVPTQQTMAISKKTGISLFPYLKVSSSWRSKTGLMLCSKLVLLPTNSRESASLVNQLLVQTLGVLQVRKQHKHITIPKYC
jgi:hypothetical protein